MILFTYISTFIDILSILTNAYFIIIYKRYILLSYKNHILL